MTSCTLLERVLKLLAPIAQAASAAVASCDRGNVPAPEVKAGEEAKSKQRWLVKAGGVAQTTNVSKDLQ